MGRETRSSADASGGSRRSISRRDLLKKAGKAAWIAPTLTVLSLPAMGQVGPPPPPCSNPLPPFGCPPNDSMQSAPQPANSKPTRKRDSG